MVKINDMDKIKEVKQILNNHSFPSTYVHGAINQGFIKDIDGTFDRIAEEIVKLFAMPVVTSRKLECSRCGAIYYLDIGQTFGCCVAVTVRRTSQICGGILMVID